MLMKYTQGNLNTIYIPLAPHQKCPKNCNLSLFQHFLAFLDSLDTFWNYNLATLAYNLPPKKISWILRTKCVQENDFSSGFQNATKKPLHVKSQKFEFYISWRGLFKQLCWGIFLPLFKSLLSFHFCSTAIWTWLKPVGWGWWNRKGEKS